MPRSMWHLPRPRGRTQITCIGRRILDHGRPRTLFLFEGMMTVKLQLLRPGLLTDISLKMNEMCMSLQENKKSLLSVISFSLENAGFNLGKRRIYPCKLDSFPVLNVLSEEIITKVPLLFVSGNMLTFEDLCNSMNQYLPNDQLIMLYSHA